MTAFPNGDLFEDVYMEQPPGDEQGDAKRVVCKRNKVLYGLKQAPRQLYSKIDAFLTNKLGMVCTLADESLYMRRCSLGTPGIALYVNDLLIACNNDSMMSSTEEKLMKASKKKDVGE